MLLSPASTTDFLALTVRVLHESMDAKKHSEPHPNPLPG